MADSQGPNERSGVLAPGAGPRMVDGNLSVPISSNWEEIRIPIATYLTADIEKKITELQVEFDRRLQWQEAQTVHFHHEVHTRDKQIAELEKRLAEAESKQVTEESFAIRMKSEDTKKAMEDSTLEVLKGLEGEDLRKLIDKILEDETTKQNVENIAGKVYNKNKGTQDVLSREGLLKLLKPPDEGTRDAQPPPGKQPGVEPVTHESVKGALRDMFLALLKEEKAAQEQSQQAQQQTLKNAVEEIINEKLPEMTEETNYQIESEKKAEFGNFWFRLPATTYGAAIWVLLVMDVKAFNWRGLSFKSENMKIQKNQWWPADATWWMPYYWVRRRLWPFLNVTLFFFVSIGLCIATFFIQGGFAYVLNSSLELDVDFRDTPGTEYICGTTGWLQLISIGFFLAYMLGQGPQKLKTMILIWSGDYETTELRGIKHKKALYRGKDKGSQSNSHESTTSQENEHDRSYAQLVIRRLFATIVVCMDITVNGSVTFVGVRYIFWSGYKSLDPGYLDQEDSDPDRFGPWPEKSGGFPWMSNTSGIEEVLMATLALVFIMDIDVKFFEFMLPACIQNIVKDTHISCIKWMPSSFDEKRFEMLGQPPQLDTTENNTREKKSEELGQPPQLDTTENNTNEKKSEVAKQKKDKMENVWMQLIPFMTFFWIAIIMAISVGTVWFVRASRECAGFASIEMPTMPANTTEADGTGLLTNDYSAGAHILFIPVFACVGCCFLLVLKYFALYILDIAWEDTDKLIVEHAETSKAPISPTASGGGPLSPSGSVRTSRVTSFAPKPRANSSAQVAYANTLPGHG